MANLAIDINSFHYRYYMFIRYMWGCKEDDNPQRTSLCPYCQTMFWGSILIVVFSWALVLGWICMKLGRIVCKLQNPWTDAVIKYVDKKTEWMKALDSGPTDFVESPMWTAIAFCLMGVAMIFVVVAVVVTVGAAFGIVGLGLWNIVDIGVAILDFVAWFFSELLFMGMYWIGFGCYHTYLGAIWLFTNGEFWYNVLCWIGTAVAWILGLGIISVILCLLCIGLSKIPFFRRFGKFLANRLNGYNEAQEQRKARAYEAIKRQPPWKCGHCDIDNLSENLRCQECGKERPKPMNPILYLLVIFYPVVWVIGKGVVVKDKIGSREINILGPLGILWSYAVAIKKGVCPIVEFVDPVQLQAEAQASAKDRMERENEPPEQHLKEQGEG